MKSHWSAKLLACSLIAMPLASKSVAQSGTTAEKSELATLKGQFDELLNDAKSPIEAFQSRYEDELKKLGSQAQSEGKLELIVEIRTELENYKKGSKKSHFPRLARLQEIYATEMPALERTFNQRALILYRSYSSNLTELQARLTRAGKVDEALEVNGELKSFSAEFERLQQGESSPKTTVDRDANEIDLESLEFTPAALPTKTDEGLQLKIKSGEKCKAETPDLYETPLRITTVAKTNSTNIRLYFGKGEVIFNWERNREELRLHDPASGRQVGVKGEGDVSPDEFHTIVWEIHDDELIVKVGSDRRHKMDGEYGGIRSKVGIGPAHGSVVTIRSLKIEKLE